MARHHQIKLDLDSTKFPSISEIIDQISLTNLSDDCLFLCFAFEITDDPNLANNFNELILAIRNKYTAIKIFLVLDAYFKYQQLNITSQAEVVYIDYWPYLVYSEVYLKQKSAIVQDWDSRTGKFLFLTGSPRRINRIRLLYKLSQENLITRNKCIWSLIMPKGHSGLNRLLPELKDKQEDFISEYTRNPDSIKPEFYGSELRYRGIPYSIELFQDTSFRVISETLFRNSNKDNPKITEKTWISILNKVPFIVAGDCGTLVKLKAMGFKTFEQYLPIPEYDTIDDAEQRLDAIVYNTKYWIDHITDNEEEIRKDVDHNVNNLYKIAKSTWNTLEKIIEYNNIKGIPPDVITTYDQTKRDFAEWYNQIKGSDWPDCNTKENFSQLPKYIQQECIEKFKFNPKEFS